jgi:hypothetical protein
MTPLQLIYDFETPVEIAFALAFAAEQIKIYTPSNEGFATEDWRAANPTLSPQILTVDFQQDRPRIELAFRVGTAAGRNLPTSTEHPPIGGWDHDLARAGIIGIRVITKVNILEHREFLAQVRGLMATILRTINGDITITDAIGGQQLVYHRLAEVMEAGATSVYTPEQGVYQTDLNYSAQLTLEENYVAALETAET